MVLLRRGDSVRGDGDTADDRDQDGERVAEHSKNDSAVVVCSAWLYQRVIMKS
jgi:hypothetical protein